MVFEDTYMAIIVPDRLTSTGCPKKWNLRLDSSDKWVTQFAILGPLLFLIFVNDLPCIALSTAYLLADDTKL